MNDFVQNGSEKLASEDIQCFSVDKMMIKMWCGGSKTS